MNKVQGRARADRDHRAATFGARTRICGATGTRTVGDSGEPASSYSEHRLGVMLERQLRIDSSNFRGIDDVSVRFIHDAVPEDRAAETVAKVFVEADIALSGFPRAGLPVGRWPAEALRLSGRTQGGPPPCGRTIRCPRLRGGT
ncbi:hypothetical protein [Micromonospora sp. NPDC002717]|uniref:hypothetical protein n=1 Tax=Micromonospora sp. NPDC002717 TaxID=3154424 RepID=UPI00332C2C15